jgi:hypothetical protein
MKMLTLHTSSYAMHFMLDEKVDQRHQRAEEGTCEDFPVFEGGRIPRT